MGATVVVGTLKGGFVLRSDDERGHWSVAGPLFKGWKVTAVGRNPQGEWLVATASDVYGCAIHRGPSLTELAQVPAGPRYPEDAGIELNQVWKIACAGDRVYAGVDEAGLFASDDGGTTWQVVEGLTHHATRDAWFPGAGGLCAHSFLADPRNSERLWCGISAVGVFRSDDGGATWTPRNEGVPVIIEDETHKDIGYCVHALQQDPDDANRIWRQDHRGMFRTADGGDHWERIEDGLPSGFGFPLALDRSTKTLFAVPLESDEYRMPVDAKLRVWRSRDGGDSWQMLTEGLPQEHAYMGVLRTALDVDHGDPCGVYLGTTAGTVHVSADGGDHWQTLPCTLPRVLTVAAFPE